MKISASTVEETLERLRERMGGSDALQELLPAYESLIRLEGTADVPPLPMDFTESEAHNLLQEGIPLLQKGEIPLFPEPMAAVWREVCDIAALHLQGEPEALEEAREWPETQREQWMARMGQYFRDGKVELKDPQEQDALTFLLVRTWRPFLTQWVTGLVPFLENGTWKRSICPACGGLPDFAYLGEEGERHMVCSRCDTQWRHRRLGCPYCGNQDNKSYGYYKDETGAYRLYTCKECEHYLKVLDLREVSGERLLTVERVVTIGMDAAALAEGYHGV